MHWTNKHSWDLGSAWFWLGVSRDRHWTGSRFIFQQHCLVLQFFQPSQHEKQYGSHTYNMHSASIYEHCVTVDWERVKNPFQHHPTLCCSSFTGTVCFMRLHIFICLVYSACVLLVSVTVMSLFAQLDSSLPQFIWYLICCAVALFWTAGGSLVYAVTALLLDGCFGKFFGTEWCIIGALC